MLGAPPKIHRRNIFTDDNDESLIACRPMAKGSYQEAPVSS